jgi:hypothetical protein
MAKTFCIETISIPKQYFSSDYTAFLNLALNPVVYLLHMTAVTGGQA